MDAEFSDLKVQVGSMVQLLETQAVSYNGTSPSESVFAEITEAGYNMAEAENRFFDWMRICYCVWSAFAFFLLLVGAFLLSTLLA